MTCKYCGHQIVFDALMYTNYRHIAGSKKCPSFMGATPKVK